MSIESALKTIGDWISKETESRKYPKDELLELSESLQTLKAEIARQSVKSEEVAEAIDQIESLIKAIGNDMHWRSDKLMKSLNLAINTLQAYQPWVSVSDRLPEEGAIVMVAYGEVIYFASLQYWGIHGKEVPVWRVGMGHRIEKDFSETHWKPYLEPPKGE